jgi:hypothetical protein
MTIQPESPPSAVRYYGSLGLGASGTMLDVGLVVLGSVLLGLAIAVVLDGFDLVSIGLGLSTGAMLGSALVIGVVGGFALGLASEGPLGRGRRLVGYPEAEILVARVLGALLVGVVFLVVESYLTEPVANLPVPFQIGVDSIRAVAVAGLTAVPLVGVPLAWVARSGYLGEAAALDGDIPVLYFVWAITTMILL